MKQDSIDVSFIIIEYHSIEDILLCVNSIRKTTSELKYEVVISSNSLYDADTKKKLQEDHPEILWSFNSKNGGFAYGMNKGIKKANGKFIILQNPDTRIINNKLINALRYLKENPEIGILGPQILNRKGEIQDSCRVFLTPSIIITRLFKRIFSNQKSILEKHFNYQEIRNVNWIIGAFMITSKEAIEKVGLLDEKYFMYVEDMDWCLRFWENELKVTYYPVLKIEYEGDRKSTLGKKSFLPIAINRYTKIHIKNYLLFLKTHGIKKLEERQKQLT